MEPRAGDVRLAAGDRDVPLAGYDENLAIPGARWTCGPPTSLSPGENRGSSPLGSVTRRKMAL
jgi:hypothetical protein